MLKIMFVCHGNICRSPMAEFITKKLIVERSLEDFIFVSSSATSSEEIYGNRGNPVYPPAQAELAKHSIYCKDKRAVQLSSADYGKFDMFVGMDNANIRNMTRIFNGDPQNKVSKLLSYAGSDADVSDPWYTDRFDIAYADIEKGCKALLEYIINNLINK